MSYAHDFEKLELVHRDINPPNIRLTYSGEVKLLDFGIAASNLHDDALGENRGAGKLWHLAPEQVRPGGTVDRRTDLYALGVVLWELLTQRPVGTTREGGQEVRQPETEGEVLVWIARGQHQAPSVFNPEVPPKLDALVAKATHVDPAKRFANADELRRELAAFIPPGWTPEPVLSSLLKELFSPEAERAERRRQIEAGRHLLAQSWRHTRQGRRATDASSSARETAPAKPSFWRRWPVLVAGMAGLLLLLWLATSTKRVEPTPRKADATNTAGARAITAPRPAAAPASSSAAATPPAGPRGATPSPLEAPLPPNPKPQPGVAETKPHLGALATGHAEEAPAVPPPAAKVDHLRLAREAFNNRDWPRALAEGKGAVAAGGGAEAHALVGNTYFKMGRFAEAEVSYGKAVALDPGSALLRERLGIARVRAREAKGGKEN